jgi:pimeloyl-ACP methyl ester carboxylesterase
MKTQYAISNDGTRIAYDITGTGPAILLLHGGWRTRQDWHEYGYVERLQEQFTVVAIDIRGNGESDKPITPAAYSITKHCEDVLAVADACGIQHFALWGFSYGGNIGRFLAVRSNRVTRLIIMGIPFGLAASGGFREFINKCCAHWQPIVEAQHSGTLDLTTLSEDDQQDLRELDVPVTIAWLQAMLDWGAVEPADLRCPTLWLVGSANATTLADVQARQDSLASSTVRVAILEGLDHSGELSEIDKALPVMVSFTNSQ